MAIKPDSWIRHMALELGMITPFEPNQVRGSVISFGLSSYGYDTRLAPEFKVPIPGDRNLPALDPKAVVEDLFQTIQADSFDLQPQTFVLARTVEYFRIPSDVLTLCVGKSSYARCGVLVNVTPFEPGWEGHATLCIANIGPRAVRLYANEGIAQVVFFQSDEACEITYADRQGKYQAQKGITAARPG